MSLHSVVQFLKVLNFNCTFQPVCLVFTSEYYGVNVRVYQFSQLLDSYETTNFYEFIFFKQTVFCLRRLVYKNDILFVSQKLGEVKMGQHHLIPI